MIRDSLGIFAAALAAQTDWKLKLTPSGQWVLKKQSRVRVATLEPPSTVEVVESLIESTRDFPV